MSVRSRKICGNELLKEGAACTAGKLIFPASEGHTVHTAQTARASPPGNTLGEARTRSVLPDTQPWGA